VSVNSDKLKEIIEKIPFSFLLVLYLGYLGSEYYAFENDEASAKVMKVKEVSNQKAMNLRLEAKVKELSQFAKTLDQKKVELRRLAQDLQEVKASLPESVDVPAFMKMIITEAKKLNLTVMGLNPTGVANQEYYAEQSFTLTFRCIFAQLVAFLDRLSNLNQIVRIDAIRLRTSGSDSARFVFVEGELELSTFKYRGSKADTLGQTNEPGAATPSNVSDPNASKPALPGGTGT
jgi:Tfp pilus assembly protein PilO